MIWFSPSVIITLLLTNSPVQSFSPMLVFFCASRSVCSIFSPSTLTACLSCAFLYALIPIVVRIADIVIPISSSTSVYPVFFIEIYGLVVS